MSHVQPHLYILRQLQNGSALTMDKELVEGEHLIYAKEIFKEQLNILLSELFNPKIPFVHNEHSTYCIDGVYSKLCHPSGLINTKLEETEIV